MWIFSNAEEIFPVLRPLDEGRKGSQYLLSQLFDVALEPIQLLLLPVHRVEQFLHNPLLVGA